jgi:hypothetical protein
MKRALLEVVAAAGLCLAALPARAQVRDFRILPPTERQVVSGSCLVKWFDYREGAVDENPPAITWYYATRADGSDKKRVVTAGRDDFRAFRRTWQAQGAFAFDWALRKDADLGRDVLRGPKIGGPLVSLDPAVRDVVISLLVRPTGARNEFVMAPRVLGTLSGYEIRNDGNALRLLRDGEPLAEEPLFEVRPFQWYWYEVGFHTLRGKAVEIRVRVYDGERKKLLAKICKEDRPRDPALLRGGLVALRGPADFAELYVDPWEARWADDDTNEFKWDASAVPDGKYYLVAELVDGKSAPHAVVSEFQLEVHNPGQTAVR